MADYKTKDIRNIALLGHGSEGKTTLTEAMLFAAGMIDRQGKVEAGTTVTDFDAEENKRGISISAATAPVEWKGTKINLIDVPGYFDFIGEMMGPLRVVETAAIVVGAVSGLTVGAEKAWAYAKKNNVCRMFIVNRMDAENANYEKTIEQLREKFGSSVVPLMLPIGEGAKFTGVVNVLENKAYSGKGKDLKEIPVPADMAPAIENALAEITEAAAEAVDELLEKYFEEDGLSQEQMNLVCDYLLSMKMAVVGYKQTGGTVKEAEKEEKQPLSAEEQKYVEEYLRGLGDMKEETQEEVRMAYYLPKVVEEAVRLHHPEVFIGDMIQEGNIALMVALKEIPKEKDEEEILEQVRAGMMASLESQTEVKRRDHKMVEKVTELDEAIKSMKEEYGRKVSVDEVAERLGISEDEIEDILKLAGEEVKDEE